MTALAVYICSAARTTSTTIESRKLRIPSDLRLFPYKVAISLDSINAFNKLARTHLA
jgi:hypothetical protein